MNLSIQNKKFYTDMKKMIMMIAVAVLTAVSANAQDAGNFRLKYRVGGNLSTVTNNEDAKYKLGVSVALGAEYFLTNKLGLSLELDRNVMGYKSKFLDKNAIIDYFHFPLQAKYYVTPWLALQAGPQIGFLARAKVDGTSVKDQCKKVEFSIPIGASFDLLKFKDNCLYVDLRYHLGLSKVNTEGSENICNRGFFLSVGYFYSLGN